MRLRSTNPGRVRPSLVSSSLRAHAAHGDQSDPFHKLAASHRVKVPAMKAVFRSKTYRQPEAGRLRHVPPQFRPQHQIGRSFERSAVPPPNENGLIPRERIQAYCDAIAREFRPRKIFLFGSYAYGQPTPDSDVDLLVVMPFRGNDVAKAIEIRSRFHTPFPLDLIVRKQEFIVRRERERDMFIELLMIEGQVRFPLPGARLSSPKSSSVY